MASIHQNIEDTSSNIHVIFCGHGKWIWKNTRGTNMTLTKTLGPNVEFSIENAQLFRAVHETQTQDSSASGLEIEWEKILTDAQKDPDCPAGSTRGPKKKFSAKGDPCRTINCWKSIQNKDVETFVPMFSSHHKPDQICLPENVCQNQSGVPMMNQCDGIYSNHQTSTCLIL